MGTPIHQWIDRMRSAHELVASSTSLSAIRVRELLVGVMGEEIVARFRPGGP